MSLLHGDTSNSLENRKIFLNDLGIDHRDLVCARQVHGQNIGCIQEVDRGRGALFAESSLADTDAMITDRENLPLAVFTADCLPVFLYDPQTFVIGIVHAGWRSTKEKILAKTVQLMQRQFHVLPKNLLAGFGPCIRQCCYRVGEEFEDYFPAAVIAKGNDFYLDLVNINKEQLLSLGVEEKKISDSKICTVCKNTDFFSYRKQGQACGRMMSVIMLR